MNKLIASLFAKCAATVEIAEDGCRISGTGLFGILGAVAVLGLIVHFAPELVGLFSSR
jgi:hypothetical protein